jgi:hypothetical protein
MTATGASMKAARGSANVQRNWSSERRYVFIFPSDVEELKKKRGSLGRRWRAPRCGAGAQLIGEGRGGRFEVGTSCYMTSQVIYIRGYMNVVDGY